MRRLGTKPASLVSEKLGHDVDARLLSSSSLQLPSKRRESCGQCSGNPQSRARYAKQSNAIHFPLRRSFIMGSTGPWGVVRPGASWSVICHGLHMLPSSSPVTASHVSVSVTALRGGASECESLFSGARSLHHLLAYTQRYPLILRYPADGSVSSSRATSSRVYPST